MLILNFIPILNLLFEIMESSKNWTFFLAKLFFFYLLKYVINFIVYLYSISFTIGQINCNIIHTLNFSLVWILTCFTVETLLFSNNRFSFFSTYGTYSHPIFLVPKKVKLSKWRFSTQTIPLKSEKFSKFRRVHLRDYIPICIHFDVNEDWICSS